MAVALWHSCPVRTAVLALGLTACLAAAAVSRSPATLSLLERYAAGEFDAVAVELSAFTEFERLLDDLKTSSEPWLAGGGVADRPRRELAAATFALEAARAAAWREWKWLISAAGPPTVYWKPAPLLIEWGCALLRKDAAPRPIERLWQLAAVAVAQRAEDPQFLIGNTEIVETEPPERTTRTAPQPRRPIGRGRAMEVGNVEDEIRHLEHVRARFPAEPRFVLAEGIAREQAFPEEAITAFRALAGHPDLAGEAEMRLGAALLQRNRLGEALSALDRAERATRDLFVTHLARVFRAQAQMRQRRERDAIETLRSALAVHPGQSASVMLAELLFQAGRRTEAEAVMSTMLAAGSRVRDPYLERMHGDDRFWPELLARLQREIRR
jgi:tetratricopeptide (TPR) repeat protein